jgi:hypothetical protein
MVETVARAGIPAEAGFNLRRVLVDAGLPAPTMRLESLVECGPDAFSYTWFVDALRSMLPLVERFGVATSDEVGIDTLADRLPAGSPRTAHPPAARGTTARQPRRRPTREDTHIGTFADADRNAGHAGRYGSDLLSWMGSLACSRCSLVGTSWGSRSARVACPSPGGAGTGCSSATWR